MFTTLFTGVAYAEGATAAPAGGGLVGFMPFIILIFVFYFLLIRPQQKRAKEHAVMLQKLQKGDNILTSGGIFGKVTNVKDDVITVEIADNVRVKVRKSSVQSRKVDGEGNDTKAIKESKDK